VLHRNVVEGQSTGAGFAFDGGGRNLVRRLTIGTYVDDGLVSIELDSRDVCNADLLSDRKPGSKLESLAERLGARPTDIREAEHQHQATQECQAENLEQFHALNSRGG